jgi:hypothetical protein
LLGITDHFAVRVAVAEAIAGAAPFDAGHIGTHIAQTRFPGGLNGIAI